MELVNYFECLQSTQNNVKIILYNNIEEFIDIVRQNKKLKNK